MTTSKETSLIKQDVLAVAIDEARQKIIEAQTREEIKIGARINENVYELFAMILEDKFNLTRTQIRAVYDDLPSREKVLRMVMTHLKQKRMIFLLLEHVRILSFPGIIALVIWMSSTWMALELPGYTIASILGLSGALVSDMAHHSLKETLAEKWVIKERCCFFTSHKITQIIRFIENHKNKILEENVQQEIAPPIPPLDDEDLIASHP